jgi:hypothetical protein
MILKKKTLNIPESNFKNVNKIIEKEDIKKDTANDVKCLDIKEKVNIIITSAAKKDTKPFNPKSKTTDQV